MISKNDTTVNEFSPELWKHLTSTLERAASETTGPRIAAFDADGTLWDADGGETFFDWQIRHAGLAGLPADPWAHYLSLKNVDPRVAYVWLAQISAGHSLAQVRKWAVECYASRTEPWPVFESQRRLIAFLRTLDFEIYIVTASVKWAVEPLGALVGVDYDHVIGIETEVSGDGIVGSRGLSPITWREGKPEGLLARTGGIRPLFASGNTLGDIALLESATHLQLAISTQVAGGPHPGLYAEESKLRDVALPRSWPLHQFRG